ncbi:MAG: DUF4215 domain-containing protein [Deltaproteobacteria bacterium]|nr:DUF4215 domain-containing protein [Deltaproteobacteria bacterium]
MVLFAACVPLAAVSSACVGLDSFDGSMDADGGEGFDADDDVDVESAADHDGDRVSDDAGSSDREESADREEDGHDADDRAAEDDGYGPDADDGGDDAYDADDHGGDPDGEDDGDAGDGGGDDVGDSADGGDADGGPLCGDGVLDPGESCDDGNVVPGDGCELDCSFTCAAAVDCDDREPCNGDESCALSHVCQAGTAPAEGSACLAASGAGGACHGLHCVPISCGDGVLDVGEACDDGNILAGDGCEPDCTFTCSSGADCDDLVFCNGVETCSASHVCVPGSAQPEGTSCTTAPGAAGACHGGLCVPVTCGDGVADPGEACDDGNAVSGDGCEADCTFTCVGAAGCDDGLLCNGAESCSAAHLCQAGTPVADLTLCTTSAGAPGVCRTAVCAAIVCGNLLVEPGEQCDDGNAVAGDGCESDCTFSCTLAAQCDDGLVCNGAESCSPAHRCAAGAPAPDLTACSLPSGAGGVCRSGLCASIACGNALVDPGEQCDDGNTDNTDACLTSCVLASCGDGFVRAGVEVCDGDPPRSCTTSCASTGTQSCVGCVWSACSPPAERCNGLDDDCDGATDNGFGIGTACDGPDSDLCPEGALACDTVGTGTICTDTTSSNLDLCNGLDDDCDPASPDGSEDPQTGAACDGADSDLCLEGTNACTSGHEVCGDTTPSTVDLCNSLDDDCDPASADGSEDPLTGASCDGADTDLCLEGTNACTGGAEVCSDTTSSTVDLCNSLDDDCDPASADGSEDPLTGAACDGADTDLCLEGTNACTGGAEVCSDTTPSTVDLCNGLDDDCDPASADGSEDPAAGGPCDGPDLDFCLEGIGTCVSPVLQCSDHTTDNLEACNGLDDDCDTLTDEDFNRDNNPLCTDGFWDLGMLNGDAGAQFATDAYWNEQWDLATFVESDLVTSIPVTGTVTLTSPPGMDFDLYVYCVSCGGLLAGSSTVHGLTGHTDVVDVARDDTSLDDTFDVIIEVRHVASSICGNWTLQVDGDTPAMTITCP